MEALLKCNWIVSIIALVDKDERSHHGDHLQKLAMTELETCITTVEQTNIDIKFIIYEYDTRNKSFTVKESVIENGKHNLQIISIKTGVDFYHNNHEHLLNLFCACSIKKAKNNPPDSITKHLLILWGHASGLGFFKPLTNFSNDTGYTAPNKYPGSVPANFTDKATGFMTGADLNAFIQAAFKHIDTGKKKPVDVLLSACCYTNMIETGYALRKSVDLFIAPQTTLSFFGYNYKQLFKLLTRNEGCSNKEIAQNITDYYLQKYVEPPLSAHRHDYLINGIDCKHDISFSANNTSAYDEAIRSIKRFTTFVKEIVETRTDIPVTKLLVNAQEQTYNVTPIAARTDIGIYDFHQLVTAFINQLPEGMIRSNIGIIASFYANRHVIARYHHGRNAAYHADIARMQMVSQSAGSFNIFLPDKPYSEKLEMPLIKLYFKSGAFDDFFEATGWDYIFSLLDQG